MKYRLAVLLMIFVVLTGCGTPNLPKNDEPIKWKKITLDDLLNGLDLKKLNKNLYGRSLHDNDVESVYDFCTAKGGYLESLEYGFGYAKEMLGTRRHIRGAFEDPFTQACIIDDNYSFIFSEQKYKIYDGRTKGGYVGSYYYINIGPNIKNKYISYTERYVERLAKEDENRLKEYKRTEVRRKIKAEEKKQELIEKENKRLALINKTNFLRSRKGQYNLSFYSKYNFHPFGPFSDESICDEDCVSKNIENTGYSSIDNALQDGWNFVSKIEGITYKYSDICTCEGVNIIMKR